MKKKYRNRCPKCAGKMKKIDSIEYLDERNTLRRRKVYRCKVCGHVQSEKRVRV